MVQTHDMKSREIPHILALYQWEYSWCPYSDAALSFFLLFLFLFFLLLLPFLDFFFHLIPSQLNSHSLSPIDSSEGVSPKF